MTLFIRDCLRKQCLSLTALCPTSTLNHSRRPAEPVMSAAKKNILYVGGLDDKVTEEVVHAAFIPFGDIKSIQLPKDFKANKQRGFAFVEFDNEDDAADAIENMHNSELFGRVIRCNVAKTTTKLTAGKAIWHSEDWIESQLDAENGADEVLGDVVLVPSRLDDEAEDGDLLVDTSTTRQ